MKKIIIALGALVAITANMQQTTIIEPVQRTIRLIQTVQNNTVQTIAAPVEEVRPTTSEGVSQQLIDGSGVWQNLKTLDRDKLVAFQRSTTDNISGVHSQLIAEEREVKENEATIKELNDEIIEIQAALD